MFRPSADKNTLFLICPGDEKINMRLGTYGRNPHEPAILIHPRIS